MKILLIITTFGYMHVQDIERVEMPSLEKCVELRDKLQVRLSPRLTCVQSRMPLQNLQCVGVKTPTPEPRPAQINGQVRSKS